MIGLNYEPVAHRFRVKTDYIEKGAKVPMRGSHTFRRSRKNVITTHPGKTVMAFPEEVRGSFQDRLEDLGAVNYEDLTPDLRRKVKVLEETPPDREDEWKACDDAVVKIARERLNEDPPTSRSRRRVSGGGEKKAA